MAIISISRHQSALGDETARALSKTLNYLLVDRQNLEEQMKTYGSLSNIDIEKFDERKPILFAGLTQAPDYYLHFLKTAMFNHAIKGNCIFVGRGASFVFHSLPGLVSVHLSAPIDIRIERVKGYFHCDERRARQLIEQRDADKAGFIRYFFGSEWNELTNYQLCLNTGQLNPDACAIIIKSLMDQVMTEEVVTLHNKALKDMFLGHTIEHQILFERNVQISFLEARVDDQNITLFGVAQSHALVAAALGIADDFKEHRQVQSEIQVIQEPLN